MNKIEQHISKGIQFNHITSVFEIFPSPLPQLIDMGGEVQEIHDAKDLFRTSTVFRFNELYLPDSSIVIAESGGKQVKFSDIDFVRWQLERFNTETLYYLINKIDFFVHGFIDTDEEYERDNNYDPDGWLSEYEEDSKDKGTALIERIRVEKADEFYEAIISGILNKNTGLLTYPETDILEDFDKASNYDKWSVNLGLVFKGQFYPYIEAGNQSNLMMDNYKLNQVWVRNYDED